MRGSTESSLVGGEGSRLLGRPAGGLSLCLFLCQEGGGRSLEEHCPSAALRGSSRPFSAPLGRRKARDPPSRQSSPSHRDLEAERNGLSGPEAVVRFWGGHVHLTAPQLALCPLSTGGRPLSQPQSLGGSSGCSALGDQPPLPTSAPALAILSSSEGLVS